MALILWFPMALIFQRTGEDQAVDHHAVDGAVDHQEVDGAVDNHAFDEAANNQAVSSAVDNQVVDCKTKQQDYYEDSQDLFSDDEFWPTPSTVSYIDSQEQLGQQRSCLDAFLRASGRSPVKKALTVPWDSASGRTRNDYMEQARKVMTCVTQVLAPNDSVKLLNSLLSPTTANIPTERNAMMLETLSAAYHNQERWDFRRQILSIMCDKFSLKELQEYIPNLTEWKYKTAKAHIVQHGRGVEVKHQVVCRNRVSPVQVEHFINFVTDFHLQDLPFGQKTILLSSGEELAMPQAVLTTIPQRLISQYESYCQEVVFEPPSQSTLRRILDDCSTKYR